MAKNWSDSDSPISPQTIRRLVVVFVMFLFCWFSLRSCVTRVDAGHVGIRVRLAFSGRGVQDTPIVTGWVIYNPVTEDIVQFPINVQNVVWSASRNEGRAVDESITFASSEGVTVNADVGLAFHIDRDRAPRLYARFRQNDLAILADGYVRNVVRDALNEGASRMPVQEIYGAGKTRLLTDSVRVLNERLSPDGFVIDQLTFTSALRLPENVVGAINRAMEATQNAIQAENRVRQIRAEADQQVEAARGSAEAARMRARGEADAVLIRARAEAQANEILRLSINPAVVSYRTLERWDGRLPVVNGSAQLPMLTIDTAQMLQVPEAERRARLRELLGAAPEPPAANNNTTNTPPPASNAPAPPQHTNTN